MNIKCPKCGKIIIDVDKKAASTTCPRCKAEIDFKAIKKDVNKKSAKKSMIFAGISALIILFVFGVSTIAFALHKDDPVHVREKEVDIEVHYDPVSTETVYTSIVDNVLENGTLSNDELTHYVVLDSSVYIKGLGVESTIIAVKYLNKDYALDDVKKYDLASVAIYSFMNSDVFNNTIYLDKNGIGYAYSIYSVFNKDLNLSEQYNTEYTINTNEIKEGQSGVLEDSGVSGVEEQNEFIIFDKMTGSHSSVKYLLKSWISLLDRQVFKSLAKYLITNFEFSINSLNVDLNRKSDIYGNMYDISKASSPTVTGGNSYKSQKELIVDKAYDPTAEHDSLMTIFGWYKDLYGYGSNVQIYEANEYNDYVTTLINPVSLNMQFKYRDEKYIKFRRGVQSYASIPECEIIDHQTTADARLAFLLVCEEADAWDLVKQDGKKATKFEKIVQNEDGTKTYTWAVLLGDLTAVVRYTGTDSVIYGQAWSEIYLTIFETQV